MKLKSETMRQKWIRGVNNLGTYGRWAFEEFNDVFEMQKEFAALIDRAVEANGDQRTEGSEWGMSKGKRKPTGRRNRSRR